MEALLIGADTLGNIPDVLSSHGIDKYTHITGRKKGMRNTVVSSNVDIVIVFTDFIEHPVLQNIKAQVKHQEIPCVFSKRSVTHLNEKLTHCLGCTHYKNGNCHYKK